jgi:hypothetical protein
MIYIKMSGVNVAQKNVNSGTCTGDIGIFREKIIISGPIDTSRSTTDLVFGDKVKFSKKVTVCKNAVVRKNLVACENVIVKY